MEWYQTTFVDSGRSPALWALIGFLVTFALVRTITRRIHARSARTEADAEQSGGGPIKDIYIGGVHVHHQVWGIMLVLVSALLAFRFLPSSPAIDVLALVFGAGAALTLDEFALWFHLDDVYWSNEGRKSIDAILIAAALAFALLLGASPIGNTLDEGESGWIFSAYLVVHMVFVLISLLKGKLATGLVGIVVPIFAWVGAARLATPQSWWAKRRYRDKKLARSRARFGERYEARHNRMRDLVGGRPEARPSGPVD